MRIALEVFSSQFRYYEMHPKMLLEMSLTYAGALYDAFISDALLAVLRIFQKGCGRDWSLTVEEALRYRDRDELVEELARREVRDLMYKSTKKQFDYFRTSFGLDVLGAMNRWQCRYSIWRPSANGGMSLTKWACKSRLCCEIRH